MYRLYEESRRRFQEFLTKLLDETADAPIASLGLQISQQEPSGKSVLDGFLYQDAVRIGIEAPKEVSVVREEVLLRESVIESDSFEMAWI